ncbi:Retrovirus-related Pol polyprotein from transposon TNT 1-94, partial [Durusdinium trenchii]
EIEERLHNKVSVQATLKPDTAFYEPWTIHLIQIAKTPKARQLPLNLLQNFPVSHRAVVICVSTGHIQIETEVVQDILKNPAARFSAPVAYAVFIYGN